MGLGFCWFCIHSRISDLEDFIWGEWWNFLARPSNLSNLICLMFFVFDHSGLVETYYIQSQHGCKGNYLCGSRMAGGVWASPGKQRMQLYLMTVISHFNINVRLIENEYHHIRGLELNCHQKKQKNYTVWSPGPWADYDSWRVNLAHSGGSVAYSLRQWMISRWNLIGSLGSNDFGYISLFLTYRSNLFLHFISSINSIT